MSSKIWPDDYTEEELIDEAAYEVMAGVNEGDRTWDDDEFLEHAAQYEVEGIPSLDESHVEEIVETAREKYA